jgi:hypothetical protein
LRTEERLARLTPAAAAILAALYAAAICLHSVPVLRHDWWWPANHAMSLEALVDATSGWLPNGIGSPAPYPGRYLVGTLAAALSLLIGGLPSLAVFSFAIGLACTLGARALGRTFGATATTILAVEVFALFNPWVYNETVAGHLYMVLAYAGCMLLVNEMLRADPKLWRLVLLPVLILPQLQFFVVALAALAIYAVVRRSYVPLLSAAVIALPIWIGLIFERSGLLTTPYTAAWEAPQSVPLLQGSVLTGYFAQYSAHFSNVQIDAVWVVVACAAIAMIAMKRRAIAVWSLLIASACILVAGGTRGPLGAWYTSAVVHIPETGLYRELYDLLGFVAIVYVVLLACLPRRLAPIGIAALIGAGVMSTAWLTFPIANYWIGRSALPDVSIDTAADTRFALIPAFQPMQFDGKGSGADPDAYVRAHNVTPLNEYFARYPVNAALSSYLKFNDVRPLQALSVSLVAQRPWLRTNAQALRLQMNGTPPRAPESSSFSRRLSPIPEVTLDELPQAGSLTNILGAGNVFFGDARNVDSALAPSAWRQLPAFIPASVSNRLVDETQGWVDVQFDFNAYPELAQGLGGAVTTNKNASLPVIAGMPMLVNVRGELVDGGRVLTRSTRGYAWIHIPSGVATVRCRGRCVVAGQARFDSIPPLNPVPRSYRPAEFTVLMPWLVRVAIPPQTPPLLRYNTAYDPNWIAISQRHGNAHLRIDATVNGWLLQPSDAAYSVFLVQRVAALQFLCEIAGVLWLIGVIRASVRRASARYPQSSRAAAP